MLSASLNKTLPSFLPVYKVSEPRSVFCVQEMLQDSRKTDVENKQGEIAQGENEQGEIAQGDEKVAESMMGALEALVGIPPNPNNTR